MKKTITPGKLYARLAAQFRARRGDACKGCAPGMPVLAPEGHANWSLAAPAKPCDACAELVDELARALQREFDLFDPTSPVHGRIACSAPGSRPH